MSEASEQKAFVEWFQLTYPEFAHCLRVSMSGLNLGGGKRAAILVKHMRGQGVQPGEADILLAVSRAGFGSLVIEHKAEKGEHRLTQDQEMYLERHAQTGNCAMCTKGLRNLKERVSAYMALK